MKLSISRRNLLISKKPDIKPRKYNIQKIAKAAKKVYG